jgi:hypothetical protein
MPTLNDEILRATGGPTVNSGLATWYSKLATESLNDAELRWLKAQVGVTAETISDCWMQYLGSLGYTGTVNDRLLAYWTAQP